jgi:hypothetical protein
MSEEGIDFEAFLKGVLNWSIGNFGIGSLGGKYFKEEKSKLRKIVEPAAVERLNEGSEPRSPPAWNEERK